MDRVVRESFIRMHSEDIIGRLIHDSSVSASYVFEIQRAIVKPGSFRAILSKEYLIFSGCVPSWEENWAQRRVGLQVAQLA